MARRFQGRIRRVQKAEDFIMIESYKEEFIFVSQEKKAGASGTITQYRETMAFEAFANITAQNEKMMAENPSYTAAYDVYVFTPGMDLDPKNIIKRSRDQKFFEIKGDPEEISTPATSDLPKFQKSIAQLWKLPAGAVYIPLERE